MRKSLLFITFVCFSRSIFSAGTLDTTLSMTDKSRVAETTGGVPWLFGPGEYAKGFVTFPTGIDVDPTGTTDIGITEVISNPINLNGGTLRLTADLRLADFVIFNGPGFIDLNGFRLKTGDQIQFRNGPVTAFSLAAGSVIEGQTNAIMQFFMGGSFRYNSLLIGGSFPSLALRNMIILDASNTNFVTSAGTTSLLQNVEFVVSEGMTFDLRGEHDTIERGFLRFTGKGSTINRRDHGPGNWLSQLTGVARLEIGDGVTYITDETFIATDASALGTPDQTRIVLNNANFVVDGVDLTMDQVRFVINGLCTYGSMNNGTLQLVDGASLDIMPGATLEVDDNMVLKLGAP